MNEQPQPRDLQPNQGDHESLYDAKGAPASSFSGYGLTQQTAPHPPAPPEAPTAETLLEWQASEYIHHAKSFGWFAGFGLVMLALLAVAYFLTHSWTFVVLVVVMAVAVGVFATRPPRTLRYALTGGDIRIENTVYHYGDFRAFGIISDGSLYSIMLIPTKRFMPAVTMYFSEADGEKIVDILGSRLPMQELRLDAIDRLMRRLRF